MRCDSTGQAPVFCYTKHMNPYNNPVTAYKYLEFLESENGQYQQKILLDAILKRLKDNSQKILDAACGSGWLSGQLSKTYMNISACDSSEDLLSYAKTHYPNVSFSFASLQESLPYPDAHFDCIILNMAVTDLEDLKKAYTNVAKTLKVGGKLIVTLPNPYYSYPAAQWKRSWLGKLLGQKPHLQLAANFPSGRPGLQASWDKNNKTSYFKALTEYINPALENGFNLNFYQELKSLDDSKHFNLQYQLYRFPLLLLLEFIRK